MIRKASEKGVINISTDVFTTIAGETASHCCGVKGMAGRGSGIWQLLSPESMQKGVEVRFEDDNSLIVDLHIVVDQGVNLYALSCSIIAEVSYRVTDITGVPVSQVNVFIDSMHRT